ncbi:MAG TPA: PIN domain-containing protein [Desulfobacteria bacterium]|nr:PIN domain-containing protein [Desulfobacteria bacterium]
MLRKEVIVDTNALLIPGIFGIDIFEELERLGYLRVIVPKEVVNELNQLRQRPAGLKGKERMAANVGHSLIQKYAHTSGQKQEHGPIRCTVTIEEPEEEEECGGGEVGDTDELIAALALKRKAAVLTNDEELRTKLTQAGIVTVYLRGRNRLEESD